ncbi:MAG: hypothetical protein WC641_03155 [Patescibacteria group bacterium]
MRIIDWMLDSRRVGWVILVVFLAAAAMALTGWAIDNTPLMIAGVIILPVGFMLFSR